LKRSRHPSVTLHLLVTIVIAQTALTQPTPIQFQHFSIEQGLSNNQVHAITQDKYGLIWIATQDGLNRFDGYNVDIYRNERGNKNSLPSNRVRCLFTDSHGVVWVGTTNGLAYYDYRSNSFQSEKSLSNNSITAINEDANGILWIGTSSGLCFFDIKKKRSMRFLHGDHSNSISSNFINDIEFAPDGTMWITTNNGLNRLDLSTMKFTSFFNDPGDSTTLSGNFPGKMAIDKDGNLWTFIHGQLTLDCFNTRTNRSKHYRNFIGKQSHVPNNALRDILIDRSGRLWLGINAAGLHLFSPDKNIFYEYDADILDPKKLQSNVVVGLFQDSSGMIWLATQTGIERFNPDESKFILYRPQSIASPDLQINRFRAIAEDPLHRLWIGSPSGVSILDRNTGTYTNYQWEPKITNSLNDNDVLSLCCDKRGNMWIGTVLGLKLFDTVNNRFREVYSKIDTLRGASFIYSLVCDRNGDLLIGGAAGLSIYDSETGSVHGLLNDAVHVIFEDKRGILWIGTIAKGLIKFNRQTGKWNDLPIFWTTHLLLQQIIYSQLPRIIKGNIG
jgi:ligand-binding sensor domain-containing protein